MRSRHLCLVVLGACTSAAAAADADAAMMAWFAACGGTASAVRSHDFGAAGFGRGLEATSPVLEGDELIRVPAACQVVRSKALAELSAAVEDAGGGDAVLAPVARADDETVLGAWLVHQRALGAASAYAAWVDVLPTSVPRTIFWDAAAVHALQDAALERDTASASRALEARARALGPLFALLAPSLPAGQHAAAFKWATSIMASRAITFQGTPRRRRCLAPPHTHTPPPPRLRSPLLSPKGVKKFLPVVDLFNYRPHPAPRDAASGNFFLQHHTHDRATGDLVVLADRDSAANAQVWMDYGDNPSRIYVMYHGFAPAENPFDCVQLELELPWAAEAPDAALRQAFAALRLGNPASVCVHGPDARATVATTALALHVHGLDPAARQACGRNPSACRAAADADGATAAAARAVVAEAAARRVAEWPTSLAEDEALAASRGGLSGDDGEASVHLAIALSYRILQKQIAAAVAATLGATAGAAPAAAAAGEAAVPDRNGGHAELDAMLDEFNAWIDAQALAVNKIRAAYVPGMRVGTIATQDIADGEVYLSVPEKLCMSLDTARRSKTLDDLVDDLPRAVAADDYLFFLLHLLDETVVQGTASFWWPYIRLLPTVEDAQGYAPVFYAPAQLAALDGSDVREMVSDYQAKVDADWKNLLGPDEANRKALVGYFGEDGISRARFTWAHQMLDSRRIWWNGQGHLVPLLDLVNCVEGPDPNRIHKTTPGGGLAATRASWDFAQGAQVYENYGQQNAIYYLYHGFALESNTHDCGRAALSLPSDREYDAKVLSMLRLEAPHRLSLDVCVEPGNPPPRNLIFMAALQHGLELPTSLDGVTDELMGHVREIVEGKAKAVRAALSTARSDARDELLNPSQAHTVRVLLEGQLRAFDGALAWGGFRKGRRDEL